MKLALAGLWLALGLVAIAIYEHNGSTGAAFGAVGFALGSISASCGVLRTYKKGKR